MKVAILGAGESGVGAAILAQKLGYEVWVSDKSSIAPNYKSELIRHGIPYEEGQHSDVLILSSNEIIKSPGIPDKVPVVKAALEKGIPVISEIEFAARHTDASIIAITGTNGKTTTTYLTYHLLHTAGFDVDMGGNVGYSFARLVAQGRRKHYVLEISSFQLDGIVKFKPHVAILLNITPDHLDRYDYQMSSYVASKFRITMNQTASDVFIYNQANEEIASFLKKNKPAAGMIAVGEVSAKAGKMRVGESEFDMSSSPLIGPHNLFNATCAIHAAKAVGVGDDAIQQALDTFAMPEHRLERVATVGGVSYINDSKATNVDAVFYALQAMTQPTVWVVGGQDKGNDYAQLAALVEQKVKAIVCLGVDNQKILGYFGSMGKPMVEARSAREAVKQAAKLATPGDVVLLSPACASFDLFKNYEDRGRQFKEAVRNLEAVPQNQI
jgi:UDP-N-acetylmuramoylalanine--D-glutamate ligase